MCMSLERRLQLLLDEERYRRVSALAQSRGTSVASVIREAIDHGLPRTDLGRARALETILSARETPVPDVPELLQELDDVRSRRA